MIGLGTVADCNLLAQFLQLEIDAPFDLRQKALRLAGRLLEFDPDGRLLTNVNTPDDYDRARAPLGPGPATA